MTSPTTERMSFSGVPLRAAFLNLLKQYDEELSDRVHSSESIRTYSLIPFPFNSEFETELEEGKEYSFSVNLFDADALTETVMRIAMGPTPELRVHQHIFPVRRIDFRSSVPDEMMVEWTGEVEGLHGTLGVAFQFLTPTQLAQYGMDEAYLLPVPEKVFPAILRVWNSVAKATRVEHVSDYYEWVTKNVYVAGHRLRTVKIPLGRRRTVVGFVGRVYYRVKDVESPLGRLTIGLARFAELCNVGKNRTAGLGRVRVRLDRLAGNGRPSTKGGRTGVPAP